MLDVQPTLAAQHAAETRGEQPEGHTVKLLALLLHACVRYALWAAGQVPAYVFSASLTQTARRRRAGPVLPLVRGTLRSH